MALAVVTGMGIAYLLQLRAQYRRSGASCPADQRGNAQGDDLVPDAEFSETRSLDIDAPPATVWPWLGAARLRPRWLVQLRALDRPWSPGGGPIGESADGILEEFQDLAEGDLVPTHPQGGFVARVVEPRGHWCSISTTP